MVTLFIQPGGVTGDNGAVRSLDELKIKGAGSQLDVMWWRCGAMNQSAAARMWLNFFPTLDWNNFSFNPFWSNPPPALCKNMSPVTVYLFITAAALLTGKLTSCSTLVFHIFTTHQILSGSSLNTRGGGFSGKWIDPQLRKATRISLAVNTEHFVLGVGTFPPPPGNERGWVRLRLEPLRYQ